MTPADDDWHAMTPFPSQLRGSRERDLDVVGAGGRPLGHDLQPVAAFLSQLRGFGELPAPRPSEELATLLMQGFTPQEAPRAARPAPRPPAAEWLRRGALAVGLSAGLSASLVGAAAASDRLPAGAQDVLARIVETVTPFDVRADQPQTPPASEERGQAPTTVEKPEAPPAESATATVQDEPDSGGATAGSATEDTSTSRHQEQSGGRRSGDADRESSDDADGDDRTGRVGGGRSADADDDEAGTAGDDDGGADPALSEDHSGDAGSTADTGTTSGDGSGDSEGSGTGATSGDSAGSGAEPDQGE